MGQGVAVACALAWLTALTFYDVTQRRLPNALTLPGAVVVLSAAALTGRGVPAVLGAVALTALYLGVHAAAPAAMGAGDVKLAIGIGGLTGAFGLDVWVLAAVGAPLLTAVWGMVVVGSRGIKASAATGETSGASAATGETSGASAATGETSGASAATGETSGASAATGRTSVAHGPSMCVAALAAVALVVL